MAISHKSQIVIQTLAPFTLAFAAGTMYLSGIPISDFAESWEKLAAVGLLAIGLGLAQDLIPKPAKEALVFFRMRNRLPGHRAFSKGRRFSSIIDREEVLDIDIRENLGEKYQDRLFYQLYEKYRENSNVSHYSFRYLQWRELASLSLICGILGFSIVGVIQGIFSIQAFICLFSSLSIFICCIFAARNSAMMLIDYVLLSEKLDRRRLSPNV